MAKQSGIITGLTAELADLKVQLEKVRTAKEELDKTARQLQDSLESLQKSSSAEGYERMKTNFINTTLKVRANQIAFLCETGPGAGKHVPAERADPWEDSVWRNESDIIVADIIHLPF